MTDAIKILLVDDHELVRGALAARLQREPDLHVVGTAATADEAIAKAIESSPDVIVMDIDMPGLNCFDAARTIASVRPEAAVIFLSAFTHDRYVEDALRVNARGYLTKRVSPETVVKAIREVASGGAYYSEEVQARIVVGSRGATLSPQQTSRVSTLTNRELEVLGYIAKGMSKKEIARVTHLSVKTVDRHCANLMTKLDIHDRVELARFAIREKITQP